MKKLDINVPNTILFSELSKDFNPIHLEKDYLSDTQFDENLQFGANILLSVLENIISKKELFISEINCEFLKPFKINSTLHLNFKDNIYSISDNDKTLATFNIKFSNKKNILKQSNKLTSYKLDSRINALKENDLIGLIGKEKYFYYSLNYNKAENLYPFLTKFCFSLIPDICFVSFLVGMRIPGEHSILSKIDYKFSNNQNINSTQNRYNVKLTKYRKAASYGTLLISSILSNMKVNFFLRPNIKTLKSNVESLILNKKVDSKYKKLSFLVLGGSKGIGLDIATHMASLGLEVEVTYKNQKKFLKDRLNLLREKDIFFKTIHYDNSKENNINFQDYDVIINCITPKIMRGEKDTISLKLFNDFSANYLGDLISITKYLSNSNKKHLLVLPSSNAINDIPIGMIEYAGAKAAMEIIAEGIEKIFSNIKIIYPRLERVRTSQTLSIINKGISSGQAAIELSDLILKNIEKYCNLIVI